MSIIYRKKMKENILFYVMIGFILLVCLKVYSESGVYNLKCIVSTIDGNKYCVREREMEQEAADLLAEVTGKCKELVKYMDKKHPNDERVKRLVKGFNPKKISETLPTSELTAYSENKGEKIAFCLNKKKNGTQLIDLNTLTFVAIHELSHIMTTTIGHKQEFWQNFKFLLENAEKAGIYKPVDYKKQPEDYCGMTISDSPLYNM
uniref:WLM domain-containing protein n=1 Tax=viral metagenome TaxID=1070528 RepID=A0A6C0HWL9_9ZZZZ